MKTVFLTIGISLLISAGLAAKEAVHRVVSIDIEEAPVAITVWRPVQHQMFQQSGKIMNPFGDLALKDGDKITLLVAQPGTYKFDPKDVYYVGMGDPDTFGLVVRDEKLKRGPAKPGELAKVYPLFKSVR